MTNLRRQRRARGMTQLELAVRAGIALRTVQRLERGRYDEAGNAIRPTRPQIATERAIRWALR